jgi:hypothetical protein
MTVGEALCCTLAQQRIDNEGWPRDAVQRWAAAETVCGDSRCEILITDSRSGMHGRSLVRRYQRQTAGATVR